MGITRIRNLILLSFIVLIIVSCKEQKKAATVEEVAVAMDIVGEEVNYATEGSTKASYDELLLARERLLKSSNENNPIIVNLDKQIEALKWSMQTSMKGFIAFNAASEAKRPGILVVHEWWGHNDYTRERANMLAELGYTAFAVDMYGDGKQANHPDDAGKFSGMVMQNIDEAQARFDAALKILKAHPSVDSTQIAAIGYCFGGSVVLTMANAGKDLDAVAAFHSGVQLPIMPNSDLKAKVLVCNGAADPFVSPESVVNFKKAMDSIQAKYTYIAYEGAQHAFTSKEADSLGKKFSLPLAYQEKADRESWDELKKLLNNTFR